MRRTVYWRAGIGTLWKLTLGFMRALRPRPALYMYSAPPGVASLAPSIADKVSAPVQRKHPRCARQGGGRVELEYEPCLRSSVEKERDCMWWHVVHWTGCPVVVVVPNCPMRRR